MKFSYGKMSSIAAFTLLGLPSLLNAFTVNYGEALQKSILFYEAQQSGRIPDWNRVSWRGDSTLNDGQDKGVDLSGGWYDAGDHVKFGFPMAASATMLAWGVVDYPEAYARSGQLDHIKNNLRFVADYFMKAHPSPHVLYGQVGIGSSDHAWWGAPEVLHATPREASRRPAFAITETCPGSDLAGETAAALAAISMIFRSSDPTYASELMVHAHDLYGFAKNFQGKYSDCIRDAQSYYNSWSGYKDELVWSALWMHRATNDRAFLNDAIAGYSALSNEGQNSVKVYKWTQGWDDKSYGSYILLSQLTGQAQYRNDAERWLDYWTTGYNGERVKYSPAGFAQLDIWGTARYAANTSFLALVYADYLKSIEPTNRRIATYRNFAIRQMEYLMGDNPKGFSYQIGMSANGPKNPHHRGAHGSWSDSISSPTQSRHLLIGALVGGPGSGDTDYADDRGNYIVNEVATDYNAGFTSALARLYLDFGGEPIPDAQFPPAERKDREFFVEAKVNSSGPRYVEIAALVHNQSAWPAKVSGHLKFRYWVDLSAEMKMGYKVSDFSVNTSYSQATGVSKLIPWGGTGTRYYVEVSFDGINIFPGGQSESKKEVQFRIALPQNSNLPEWDNGGDPSWDSYSGAYKVAPKIALYDDGKLVWGQEPGTN